MVFFVDEWDSSRPIRGERYTVGFEAPEVFVFGWRRNQSEGNVPLDGTGNAVRSPAHFRVTSSDILEALLRRRISSTSKDGPEITLESETLRMVRRRIPPLARGR